MKATTPLVQLSTSHHGGFVGHQLSLSRGCQVLPPEAYNRKDIFNIQSPNFLKELTLKYCSLVNH
jgi:hypothetical protein